MTISWSLSFRVFWCVPCLSSPFSTDRETIIINNISDFQQKMCRGNNFTLQITNSVSFFLFYRRFRWLAPAWTWQRPASPPPTSPSSSPSPSRATERGRSSPPATPSWMVTKSSHPWKTEQCNLQKSKNKIAIKKEDYLKKNWILCDVLGHFQMFCFKCTVF